MGAEEKTHGAALSGTKNDVEADKIIALRPPFLSEGPSVQCVAYENDLSQHGRDRLMTGQRSSHSSRGGTAT